MRTCINVSGLVFFLAAAGWAQRPRSNPAAAPPYAVPGYNMWDREIPAAPPAAGRSEAATVSVRQLLHKIPGPALKAFSKGFKAAKKGNQQEAVDYFRQAVATDPEFADAYDSLGVSLAALGDLPQAADQFQKAIDLVPEHPTALPNMCIVLGQMQRYREAALVARRAMALGVSPPPVYFILGVSLVAEHGDAGEALTNLQRAARDIPQAHLLAADLLAHAGRREDAAEHLQNYLRLAQPQDAERAQVEAWLARLRP
jgi:tetratricopeptide (TPR) repeat protein